jgi:hypothetical protein
MLCTSPTFSVINNTFKYHNEGKSHETKPKKNLDSYMSEMENKSKEEKARLCDEFMEQQRKKAEQNRTT